MRLGIDQELALFTHFQIETIEIHILDLRANMLSFIAFRTDGHVTDPSVLDDRHARSEHAETLAIDKFFVVRIARSWVSCLDSCLPPNMSAL